MKIRVVAIIKINRKSIISWLGGFGIIVGSGVGVGVGVGDGAGAGAGEGSGVGKAVHETVTMTDECSSAFMYIILDVES